MKYAVILRPGYYGDVTEICSTHSTPELAWRAANNIMRVVAVHNKAKCGDKLFGDIANGMPTVPRDRDTQ